MKSPLDLNISNSNARVIVLQKELSKGNILNQPTNESCRDPVIPMRHVQVLTDLTESTPVLWRKREYKRNFF